MGYAVMSARKNMLVGRINNLNMQIMNLSEAENSQQIKMGNWQRAMSNYNYQKGIQQQWELMQGIESGSYGYTANGYDNEYKDMFAKYAYEGAVENDIEQQKKQLETQLQVAQQELESVEKAEEAAIKRATPKYA